MVSHHLRPTAGLYSGTWFIHDYAEMRVVLDESEPMGDVIRICVIQRIFGFEPTLTTLSVDRKIWEELMRTRQQVKENE